MPTATDDDTQANLPTGNDQQSEPAKSNHDSVVNDIFSGDNFGVNFMGEGGPEQEEEKEKDEKSQAEKDAEDRLKKEAEKRLREKLGLEDNPEEGERGKPETEAKTEPSEPMGEPGTIAEPAETAPEAAEGAEALGEGAEALPEAAEGAGALGEGAAAEGVGALGEGAAAEGAGAAGAGLPVAGGTAAGLATAAELGSKGSGAGAGWAGGNAAAGAGNAATTLSGTGEALTTAGTVGGNLAGGATAATATGAAASTGTAVTAEGVAVTAGVATAPETAGIGALVGLAVAALIALRKKIWALIKNLGKAAIGLIILLFMILNLGIASWAGGPANGGGGKSAPTPVGQNSNQTAALLGAIKQNAKSNPAGGGSGETVGTLKNGSGFSIKDFKRIKFENSRDVTFLNNIQKLGSDPKHNTRLDQRIVQSLIYLANRHNFLDVRNLVSKYEDMPIDTENSSNPQVIANISAHTSGQAADLSQIDFVYEGMDPLSCTTDPDDPRRDIVWFNDRNQELLRQKCKGKIYQPFTGGPIIGTVSTQAFPIQVAWQDDSPSTSGNMASTIRGSAERLLEQSAKLPTGSLDQTNANNSVAQIGFAEIAQQIGLNPALMTGNNSNQLFSNVGEGLAENSLGLATGSLKGSNLSSVIEQTGKASMEDYLSLPTGSWKGTDIKSVVESIGKTTLEREFGLADGTLSNAKSAQTAIIQEAINDSDMQKIAGITQLPQDQLTEIINQAKSGTLTADSFTNLGERRLETALNLESGTLDTYIAAAQNKDKKGLSSQVLDDLSSKIDFNKINVNIEGKQISISQDQVKNVLSQLGQGENISQALKGLGGSQLDNTLALERGTSESFATRGDGDPSQQVDLLDDSLLKGVGQALFSNQIGSYLKDYGQDKLQQLLQAGPRNMTVNIDDETKNEILTDPLNAAEKIGSSILKNNLSLTDDNIESIKGGDIKSLSAVANYLKNDFKWSDSDINAVPNDALVALPSVQNKLMSQFKLSSEDVRHFLSGDFANISTIQEAIADQSNSSIDDIKNLTLKDLKNIGLVKNVLSSQLKWDEGKISTTPNSQIQAIPQVAAALQSKFKLSPDDWTKYTTGGIVNTGLFQQISKQKIGCGESEASQIAAGEAKNVPAIKNSIMGLKLSSEDLKSLRQGDIKSMPSVQNTLKTKFNLNDDDLTKLMSGDVKDMAIVQNSLTSKLNLPEGDVEKLLSGDFKDLQVARNVITQQYGVSGGDIDKILNNDLAHTDFVQSQLVKQLNLSDDDASRLVDSNFKDMGVLQDMVMSRAGINKDEISGIMKGDLGVIKTVTQRLTSAGKLKSTEIASITKADWLGVDGVKADFANKLNIDLDDVETIKLGQIGGSPLIQNIALDKFKLDFSGLANLKSGAWGELSDFQTGFMSQMKLNLPDLKNILAGNIHNLSSVASVLKGQFNLSTADLGNFTGRMNLTGMANMDSLTSSLALPSEGFANVLGGVGSPASMINLGGTVGGFGFGGFGSDQAEIREKVYKPEARYKVHQVISELLDMPGTLNYRNLLVIQLITYSQSRDVDPFEPKLEQLYDKSKQNGGSRAENYGLFSMKEAYTNIHIGY